MAGQVRCDFQTRQRHGRPMGKGPTAGGPRPRDWSLHIWEGCDLYAWLKLLRRNRWAVDPAHWHVAAFITPVSFGHTVLRWLQQSRFGEPIARTPIRHAPLFILGHWRSGTTFLHELLILDERHNYPSTYESLEPHHFLLTERLAKRYLNFVVPERRPMDNMSAGFDRPQEDEFALCMMGVPSPYLQIAFPNHGPVFEEYFDLEAIT